MVGPEWYFRPLTVQIISLLRGFVNQGFTKPWSNIVTNVTYICLVPFLSAGLNDLSTEWPQPNFPSRHFDCDLHTTSRYSQESHQFACGDVWRAWPLISCLLCDLLLDFIHHLYHTWDDNSLQLLHSVRWVYT